MTNFSIRVYEKVNNKKNELKLKQVYYCEKDLKFIAILELALEEGQGKKRWSIDRLINFELKKNIEDQKVKFDKIILSKGALSKFLEDCASQFEDYQKIYDSNFPLSNEEYEASEVGCFPNFSSGLAPLTKDFKAVEFRLACEMEYGMSNADLAKLKQSMQNESESDKLELPIQNNSSVKSFKKCAAIGTLAALSLAFFVAKKISDSESNFLNENKFNF